MNTQIESKFHRAIHSFVRREGRMTTKQQWALTHLWPIYGIDKCLDDALPLDFSEVFDNNVPVIVEVGFGDGTTLLAMAEKMPQYNFLGIEVYRNGVGSLLAGIHEKGLKNIKILIGDAVAIFQRHIPDLSLMGVQLFFPDPWPKKRHHKRRIVQPNFVDCVAKKLIMNGYFHLATDWENYALHMMEVLSKTAKFKNASSEGFIPRPTFRPMTKFEKRGQKLGHGVWDLMFYRMESSL